MKVPNAQKVSMEKKHCMYKAKTDHLALEQMEVLDDQKASRVHFAFSNNTSFASKMNHIQLQTSTHSSYGTNKITNVVTLIRHVYLAFRRRDLVRYRKNYLSRIRESLLNSNDSFSENVTKILVKLGVRRFSSDDVLELVILSCICDGVESREVTIKCFLFVVFCLDEREDILSWLRKDGFVWTSDGCKRLGDVDIHFGKGYRNVIDMEKLVNGSNMKCYEVNVGYLDHPVVKSKLDFGETGGDGFC
ncbi:hypothetical protein Tco_0712931 [Tanacetum coccineum]